MMKKTKEKIKINSDVDIKLKPQGEKLRKTPPRATITTLKAILKTMRVSRSRLLWGNNMPVNEYPGIKRIKHKPNIILAIPCVKIMSKTAITAIASISKISKFFLMALLLFIWF